MIRGKSRHAKTRKKHTKRPFRNRGMRGRRIAETEEQSPPEAVETGTPTGMEGALKSGPLEVEMKGAAQVLPGTKPGEGGEPRDLPEPVETFPTREQATTQSPKNLEKGLVLGRRGMR